MNKEHKSTSFWFVGELTIAFIVLKLLGVIDWSWLWVLSPIWLTTVIIVAAAIILVVIGNRK